MLFCRQLVNSLTDERADIGFIDEFLYTYRYFTCPDRFLDHLQRRYRTNNIFVIIAVFTSTKGTCTVPLLYLLPKKKHNMKNGEDQFN